MKMLTLLLRYSTAVLLAVSLATGAASGADVMKAVGDEVSFRPDKPLPSPVTSIGWKHTNSAGEVIKAIEWDEEEGLSIPNPRFKGITHLDIKTGQITITKLSVEHSGNYIIEIDSKLQEQQRFTLTVKERVPKPVIKIEKTGNTDVVYLRCEYSEPITWKNSAGETLPGSPIAKGESITIHKSGDPENFYTCTLDNGASQETSDQVYEKDLFTANNGIGAGAIVGIVIGLLLLIGAIISGVFLYKRNREFNAACVRGIFPCIQGAPKEAPKSTEEEENHEIVPLKTKEDNHQQDAT